jgi:hypothetical protein
MVRIGELALPASDTVGGPLGDMGSRLVTGAAMSTDGAVLAVRSYTDAWLYPVREGDLVDALSRAPVAVPLPGEPQGEAIAFDTDGALLSGSETRDGVPGEIRAVPDAVGLALGGAPAAPPASANDAGSSGTLEWLPAAVGGGAVVGGLAVLMGAIALRGARRRR